MTEDCPGYDRERRACLLRPADCEFVPGAEALPGAEPRDGHEVRHDVELPA